MKYILQGHDVVPVDDVLQWAKWFQVADRHVANDNLSGVQVSTVFLGLDHRFNLQGPPIVFETMVFGGEFDQYQERYSSWEEAENGHAEILQRVKTALEH